MHHIHLNECPSTQDYLKNFLRGQNFQKLLISCDHQTQGKGRQGNTWFQGKDSLAFSFALLPNKIISLTSLEIGILAAWFFKETFNLEIKLKWPNDLMTLDLEKCGGILCQTFDSYFLVGIGLNLGEIDFEIKDLNYKISSLPKIGNKKDLPFSLYKFILENRLSSDKIKSHWENLCCHLDREVQIENEKGTFRGIGEHGEALLKVKNEIKKIYSGSLTFSPKILKFP